MGDELRFGIRFKCDVEITIPRNIGVGLPAKRGQAMPRQDVCSSEALGRSSPPRSARSWGRRFKARHSPLEGPRRRKTGAKGVILRAGDPDRWRTVPRGDVHLRRADTTEFHLTVSSNRAGRKTVNTPSARRTNSIARGQLLLMHINATGEAGRLPDICRGGCAARWCLLA